MSSRDPNLNSPVQNQLLSEPLDPMPLRCQPSPIKQNGTYYFPTSPVPSQKQQQNQDKPSFGFQSKTSNFRKSSYISKSERSDHSIEPFQSESMKSPRLDENAIPQEDLNNFYISTLTPTKFTKPLASVTQSPSHFTFFAKQQQQQSTQQKCCNCKKTHCLKLYCECFANGEYCNGCNCIDCQNNKENDAKRFSAIEKILEKNPEAFNARLQSNPENNEKVIKIASGCTCKKSSCLRKYCECYAQKIPCSDKCKCSDCKNPFGNSQNNIQGNQNLEFRLVKKVKKGNQGSITEMLLLNPKN